MFSIASNGVPPNPESTPMPYTTKSIKKLITKAGTDTSAAAAETMIRSFLVILAETS
jgi:hypothetical protein